MARTKEVTAEEIEDTELNNENYTVLLSQEEAEENEKQKALDDILNQLGEDHGTDLVLKTYRLDDDGNRVWCRDYYPSDLPLEPKIQSKFGGGEYIIKVYGKTGRGKSVLTTVKMYLAQIEKEDIVQPQPNQTMDLAALLSTQQNNIEKLILTMSNKQAEQQSENMRMMMELMVKMQPKEKDNTSSLLETITVLKSLEGDKKDPITQLKDLLEVKDMLGNDGKSTNYMDLLNKGLETVGTLAKGEIEKKQHQQQQTPPQPQKQAEPSQRISQQQSNQMGNEDMNVIMRQVIKQHLQGLIVQASKDRTPETYAELTLDNIPEEYHSLLLEALGDNNITAINNLAEIEPGIIEYTAWFEDFCTWIRDEFNGGDSLLDDDENGIKPETEEPAINANQKDQQSETDTGAPG